MHGQDFQPVHFFRLLLILREGDFHRRVKRVQQPPRSLFHSKDSEGKFGKYQQCQHIFAGIFNLFYNRWVDLFLFQMFKQFFHLCQERNQES